MNPDAQLVAMAEACGWQHRWVTRDNPVERAGFRLPNAFSDGIEAWWTDVDGDYPGVYGSPPRYLNSLDAMARAEDYLFANDDPYDGGCLRYRYAGFLYDKRIVPEDRQPLRATAAQRCEAMLRTLGKWTT